MHNMVKKQYDIYFSSLKIDIIISNKTKNYCNNNIYYYINKYINIFIL